MTLGEYLDNLESRIEKQRTRFMNATNPLAVAMKPLLDTAQTVVAKARPAQIQLYAALDQMDKAIATVEAFPDASLTA